MNRALETVEGMPFAGYNHFEGFVIVVSAGLTFGHINTLRVISVLLHQSGRYRRA
jgi:hypothetical protein